MTSQQPNVALPKWKCHKEVQAAKIITMDGHILSLEVVDGGPLVKFYADTDWMERHKPRIGGYLVRYADGYESFSPGKAFEEGYTRL